ncbi:MAG: hypothetical protein KDN19_21965, partial [Verrucomicrobiae bacterium]|nr:hypothetical protein [Verrucomicrobiae bacterium]
AGDSVPVSDGEIIVFRGRDPRLWNSRTETELLDAVETDEPAAFSLPLDEVPAGVGFLRIRRLDTGDSVVATLTRDALLSGGCAKVRRGWSGRGEQYFGASHLGLFDEALPREVETKFGAGGWGFGHRESIGSGQAFAWAGQSIEPGAGFEISVGPMPEGARIEPFFGPDIPTEESATISEEEIGPQPITAATVAAALAANEAATSTIPEPKIEEPEPQPLPSPFHPDLESLTRQADNRSGGLLLFRANDPTLWGTEVFSGANRRARSLEFLPEGLAYLRLRRVDTGEGIVVPIRNEALTDDADGHPRGFNGTNELFYGAHHLGIFDETLPQDVETRFTYGGWGFGHSVLGPEQQACGWEGRPIAPDTVFEITVFRRMPVLDENDRLLEA